MIRTTSVAALAAVVLATGSARAQSFPGNDRYLALPCAGGTMTDGHRDQPGALRERDIVGDTLAPAGHRAADDKFLYIRMRLDDDPAPGGVLRPFAWGFEVDVNATRSTYEVLIVVSGASKNIAVYKNTAHTLPDDPNDPADEPPVATFPFATHGRSVVALSSRYGGDDDYYLELAVPWATLEPLGLTRTAPLTVWAATSSNATSLNGDFACHDGASGAPKLSTIAAPPTTLDPVVDTDGDGWSNAVEVSAGTDPNDPKSKPSGTPPALGADPVIEGAGGCTLGASHGSGGFMLAAALAASIVRRRRRA
ncbi:MAG: hypothetical protein HYV09_14130 [Deltaproteobacteria bacterium]|nr:hypothetical protein [Deltaproteobacteria bacterium]